MMSAKQTIETIPMLVETPLSIVLPTIRLAAPAVTYPLTKFNMKPITDVYRSKAPACPKTLMVLPVPASTTQP
jgi:hypothetical protein